MQEGARLMVDELSMTFLEDCEIDYTEAVPFYCIASDVRRHRRHNANAASCRYVCLKLVSLRPS